MRQIRDFSPFELHTKLLESISYTKTGFVVIGKLLHELRNDETYRSAVGSGIDTWDDYITQPEIGLSRGEANRLIQIYEELVLRLGLSEEAVASISIKNLHYLLPIVKKAENIEEVEGLIGDAQSLSQKDFRERVYEAIHEDETRTYTYLVMKRCNETSTLSRVHGIESDEIISKFNLNSDGD